MARPQRIRSVSELAVLPLPEILHERRHDDLGWWLDQEAPVPLWNLVAGAAQTHVSVTWAVERSRALGFNVREITDLPEVLKPAVEASTNAELL